MNNILESSRFSGGFATAAVVVMTVSLWSIPETTDAHSVSTSLDKRSEKFSIFENNEPTGVTADIRSNFVLEKKKILDYSRDIAWIDEKIEDFMSNLSQGVVPSYSENLLSLAGQINKLREI